MGKGESGAGTLGFALMTPIQHHQGIRIKGIPLTDHIHEDVGVKKDSIHTCAEFGQNVRRRALPL